MRLEPQPGPQTKFLESDADIAIYGGAAGGGKTFGMLLETLRHVNASKFEGVIFRRERPQITNPGGIWDESMQIFPMLGANAREGSHLDWNIDDRFNLKFAHMALERNMYDWQGAALDFIGWEELTHFTRKQFFYMLSRLRSTSGIKPYVRATCNPDADSWVAKFIQWWWDPESGFPIAERDGVLRWFIRQGDDLVWADSKEDLIEEYGDAGEFALSVTFIAAKIQDNKILLEKNPEYLARLNALDRVERARLKDGNWKIRASAGMMFRRSDFKIVKIVPNCVKWIRYWDRAATEPNPENPNPDWTVGCKMGITSDKQIVIAHVERFRKGPLGTEKAITNTTNQDTYNVTIGIEQDPGQAGKVEAESWTRKLMGFDVRLFPVHKDKVTRARGYAAQVEAGNVLLVEGEWNDAFLDEHENFPPKESASVRKGGKDEDSGKDDQVDAASGGFNFLTGDKVGQMVAPSDQGTQTIAQGFTRGIPEW